jgi:hypothetical protein
MNKEKLIQKYSIKKPTKLDYLAVGLFAAGMLIGVLSVKIVEEGNLVLYRGIIASLITLPWGCVGIIVIKQRKLPGIINIYGKPAVFLGIVMSVVFWSISIYGILYTIRMTIL